ncbi:hypothetical protein N9W79_01240 [bacterium]|nr:hypothetical protein [bacterium]
MCDKKTISAKVILCFDNTEEAKVAMDGWKYKFTIEEVWEKVFRPNFKHGYNDETLDNDLAYKVIERLSEIYSQAIEDRNIDLYD